MDILPYDDTASFADLATRIKKNAEDWQVVEVALDDGAEHNTFFIARRLRDYFVGKDGAIIICNNREILAFVRMSPQASSNATAFGLMQVLASYKCTVAANGVTGDGLARIRLRVEESRMREKWPLLRARMARTERIVMIAEDDMFVRSLMAQVFTGKVSVVELASAEQIVDTYLEYLPDILFLDIHLPGGAGLDALKEISACDPTAFVVIVSSDSVRDNVLNAKELGAKGFLAKSFTPEQLEQAYQRCLQESRHKLEEA